MIKQHFSCDCDTGLTAQVEVLATGNEDTDNANVQREIRQVQKRKGNLRVVQGRGFEVGDTAVVDFDAARADTGEVFPGAKRVKTQLDSDSADMQFLPGAYRDFFLPAVLCSVLPSCAVVRCSAPCRAAICCAIACCVVHLYGNEQDERTMLVEYRTVPHQ